MSLNDTCPTCGSTGFDFEPLEYSDEDTATEVVSCTHGHAWRNTWRLDGPPVALLTCQDCERQATHSETHGSLATPVCDNHCRIHDGEPCDSKRVA